MSAGSESIFIRRAARGSMLVGSVLQRARAPTALRLIIVRMHFSQRPQL